MMWMIYEGCFFFHLETPQFFSIVLSTIFLWWTVPIVIRHSYCRWNAYVAVCTSVALPLPCQSCSGVAQFSALHPSEFADVFRSLSVVTLNPVFKKMVSSSKANPGRRKHTADSDSNEAGPSRVRHQSSDAEDAFSGFEDNGSDNGGKDGTGSQPIGSDLGDEGDEKLEDDPDGLGDGMDLEGFSGPKEKVVKPLTPEALAAFKAAKEGTGVVYISRIPPGMRPTKVRHLMNQYGEVGKVYLQQEGECVMP